MERRFSTPISFKAQQNLDSVFHDKTIQTPQGNIKTS